MKINRQNTEAINQTPYRHLLPDRLKDFECHYQAGSNNLEVAPSFLERKQKI
jgi:hypothetical protein